MSDLRDRFRGAMLGTAVGDALGAPFEGQPIVEASRLDAWANAGEPLRWTDDTHMAIGIAESLLARGGLDGDHLAGHLASAYHGQPWRGYGSGPPRVFAAMARGVPWRQAAASLFAGQGSRGDGAAMRVAPAALLGYPDLDRVAALARDTARVTHTHELALQGAALQACAVGWLLGAGLEEVAGLLPAVDRFAPAPEYQEQFGALAVAASRWSVQQAAATLGTSTEAVHAVPAALFALRRHPESFPDAVRAAVSLGGDTDTIAAMTGALSGALLGAEAIPPGWRDRLEAADHLTALADGLLDLSGA